VADYRPVEVVDQKIKKSAETMTLTLVRNPDIIGTIAARSPRPLVVGFAAETQDIQAYGEDKLVRKGLDLLFANEAVSTFGSEAINATALWRETGQETESANTLSKQLGPASKTLVARQMLSLIHQRWLASNTSKNTSK